MASRNRDFFTLSAHQRPMAGDTKFSALSVDHMGWLVCDGRALNVTDYRFLFDVIGYSFGSNGTTQFKLPNPAGRVLGAIGTGAGLTARALGDSVGEETHTLTIDEMPTHNHTITDPGHNHGYQNQANVANPAVSATTMDVADNANVNQSTTTSLTGISINNTGGSNAHNNMQPTLFAGNLFMFSGKFNFTNAPFTSGIFVGGGNVPSGANVL